MSETSDTSFAEGEETLLSLEESESGDEPKVVYARGIAEGLVVRLDGSCDPLTLQAALRDFMISRSEFLKGSSVFADWFGQEPSKELRKQVGAILKKEFLVEIEELPARLRAKVEVSKSNSVAKSESVRGNYRVERSEGVGLSLFDGFGATEEADFDASEELGSFAEGAGESPASPGKNKTLSDARHIAATNPSTVGGRLAGGVHGLGDFDEESLADIPDARMVFGTLRSGQRVESEHSLIVAGDVNSGAELIAGGDIFVLGKLRGVAHAGAYDETGAGRVIFALELEPTQLRIGGVITRGGSESRAKGVAELARVDGDMIVVEPYQTRRGTSGGASSRRGRMRGFRMRS